MPVFFAAASHGLACFYHIGFAESHDEIPVYIADIHADGMNRKGYGAHAGCHAGEKDHTDSLAALFGKDRGENRNDFIEIFLVRNPFASGEETILIKHAISKNEGEEGAYGSSDGCAFDSQGRERSETADEEEAENGIQYISAHVDFHDFGGISIAQLHGLENQGEGGEINAQQCERSIFHGQFQIVRLGAHEEEYFFHENKGKDMEDTQGSSTEGEGLFQKLRHVAASLFTGAGSPAGDESDRRGQGPGKAEEHQTGLEEDADGRYGKASQCRDQDEVGRGKKDHKESFQCCRERDAQVMPVIMIHGNSSGKYISRNIIYRTDYQNCLLVQRLYNI